MWNERQWRDRRIGVREILSSWVIIVVIAVSLIAWAGVQALMSDSDAPRAEQASR